MVTIIASISAFVVVSGLMFGVFYIKYGRAFRLARMQSKSLQSNGTVPKLLGSQSAGKTSTSISLKQESNSSRSSILSKVPQRPSASIVSKLSSASSGYDSSISENEATLSSDAGKIASIPGHLKMNSSRDVRMMSKISSGASATIYKGVLTKGPTKAVAVKLFNSLDMKSFNFEVALMG
jgi:hypothetical protein